MSATGRLPVVSLALILGASMVTAQDYPSKPIRILAGEVGGSSDFSARAIAQGLTSSLGQSVIVENRTSNVLAGMLARSPADGYTLHLTGSVAWVSPFLRKVDYDPIKDFSPITLAAIAPFLLLVHPSVPVKSVKELIALAKARPDELNHGYSGIGGAAGLATDLFKSMAGVKMVKVNYKGSGSALNGLLVGEVQVQFGNDDSLKTLMKTGRVRALAVTSAAPSALHPGMPTVAASGVPGYEAVSIVGLWAPAATPTAIINLLNRETVRVLVTPDVKERFFSLGTEVIASSPAEFSAKIRSEIDKWGKVIKEAGIKLE